MKGCSGENWWQGGDALSRFIVDLVSAEQKLLRPAGGPLPVAWPVADMRLDEAGLGLDGPGRLQVAATLSEALHLREGGLEDDLLARSGPGRWCGMAAESLRQFSAMLTFRTSGSTGVPKSCTHPIARLEQEVDTLTALLSGAGRVLTAVPCHHIYGFLFTILLPRRLGGPPVLDVRGHSPGGLASLARPGDLVIGHPAFWAAVARAAPSGWPPGVTGVTSTAPCPVGTASAMTAAGLSRLLQIHGSSETAGIGWRDDPDGPYTLMPHWDRELPRDRDTLPQPEHDIGRLRRTSVPGCPAGSDTVVAPDRLEWLDRRRYHVRGRQDGAVQVGGVNVFPTHVGDVLRKHPGVAAAAVRLMRPSEGLRLKAFIVPRDPGADAGILRRGLDALAAAALTVAERPRAYSFGRVLPIDPMGKAADWQIMEATLQPAGA